MLANRTSRWSIGTALICVALLAAAWFLLISPRRDDASSVRGQAVQADNQAATLTTQIAELKSEFADLPKRRAELKVIQQQLPPGAELPTFVRDLQSLAADAGVSMDSITPGAPTVLAKTGVAAPVTAGSGSVVSVPMTIVVTGEYFEGSLFLKNLQTKLERSYLVTGLAAAPAVVDPAATATATATATPTSTASTPTASATTAPVNLDPMTLTVEGSVFVLLDGTSTFDDVAKDAKAAGKTAATATPTPTSASTVAAN
jgi:Tfp pilus assembly protein PilO